MGDPKRYKYKTLNLRAFFLVSLFLVSLIAFPLISGSIRFCPFY